MSQKSKRARSVRKKGAAIRREPDLSQLDPAERMRRFVLLRATSDHLTGHVRVLRDALFSHPMQIDEAEVVAQLGHISDQVDAARALVGCCN